MQHGLPDWVHGCYILRINCLSSLSLPVCCTLVALCLSAGSEWDWSGRSALPSAAVAAAAAQQSSPQQQPQQQQQQPVVATLEEYREKGELQRSYYSMLLALTTNTLTSSLLTLPPQALDNLMTALAKGAATHVDPSVRKSCIQVGGRGACCLAMLSAGVVCAKLPAWGVLSTVLGTNCQRGSAKGVLASVMFVTCGCELGQLRGPGVVW